MLLICQHCKHPCAAEARFCSDCGTELFRQECSACHAINELGAQHCHACGVALRAAAALAAAAGTPGRTGFAPLPEFAPSSTAAQALGPVITTAEPQVPSLVTHPPVQWQGPAPAGRPRQHPALAPFLVGLGTVGTLALISIAFVNWSTSSTAPAPVKPLDRPVAAGLATERSPLADKAVDAAADAAAAAAAKLLDAPAGADRRAGRDAPRPATAPTAVAPTAAAPMRPAGERDVPAAQVQARARAPGLTQARTAPAADVALTTRAEARVPQPAAQTARVEFPAPTAVRAAPAQPAFEPPLAARQPRAKPAPSVLPAECTAAMQALAICTTSSKPPGS